MYLYLLGLLLVFLIWLYPQRHIRVARYENRLDGDYKFLALSDMHNNGLLPFKRFRKILEKEEPQAIFLLGDMIDRKPGFKNTERLLDIIEDYGVPVFYIHGNHEMTAVDIDKLNSKLDEMGAINLLDRVYDFKGLEISGIGYEKESKYPADIYLVHNPLDGVASRHGGLFLAGHTHGGMVRLPLIRTFYVPDQGFNPRYDKGLYELCKKDLIITSGIGNTFLPIRFLNPIELMIIS